MTTSATDQALPGPVSLDEWERLGSDVHELVDGIPIVTPTESGTNSRGARLLANLLESRTSLRAYTPLDVALPPGPRGATVRCPDLVLVTEDFDPQRSRAEAAEVELVAEFVSPESVERDWITKRREYAAAGIPRYLVVDMRRGHLALFDRIQTGRYLDPTHPHGRASLDLDGERVDLRLDDLR